MRVRLVAAMVLWASQAMAGEVVLDKKEFTEHLQRDAVRDAKLANYGKQLEASAELIAKQDEVIDAQAAALHQAEETARLMLQLQVETERQLQAKRALSLGDKAEWAGYGAAVPVAITLLRKLVLKF